jgi:hypothetical protein
MKCSKCLLSGFFNDPIFVGIEKVFARIVTNHYNKNNNNFNNNNTHPGLIISYSCQIMNFFQCPFESKENNSNIENNKELIYPYKREDLFFLERVAFVIEQAITTIFEITRNNEIIFEVDFENDRVQEIHTKYSGEPESWGWNNNVNEILSNVKPISTIQIRDEKDIYSILTNREKLECLIEEYEKYHQLDNEGEQIQVCCDENTPCVPNDNNNSNNKKTLTLTPNTTNSLETALKKQQQQVLNEQAHSHKGENCHSKNNTEEKGLYHLS